MPSTRPPAVAGTFYPADPSQLRRMVQQYLTTAKPFDTAPKAIIAPHAGYIYSGPVAASVYAALKKSRSIITRVVLLGPAHRVAFRGLAVSSADAFSTPLGKIPLDQNNRNRLLELPFVFETDRAHAMEHSLEVQLPFLQEVLDDFQLTPLVVGDALAEEVCEVLELLWDGPETLLVISSDLSHYHDYATAKRMDTATSQAIEQLQPEKIDYASACGRTAVNGLLLAAQHHHLHAATVDLRNSGDTAGPRDQVVGYGAYAFN